MKDSGFRIRVQRDLRQQFVEACRAEDKPAAQVMREFMRDYVAHRSRAKEMMRPSGVDGMQIEASLHLQEG